MAKASPPDWKPMYRFFSIVTIAITMSGCDKDVDIPFQRGVEVPIQGYNVHTVGSADFNGDAVPDLYTVNHSSAPSILLGAKTPWVTLPHEPRFPALFDLAKEPEAPHNGALLYWHRMAFKIATGALKEPIRGNVIFRGKPIVDAPIERLDETHWLVRFTLASQQTLVIRHKPSIAGLPVKLHIDSDPLVLSIGKMGDHPDVDTEFRLRDYHALLARDIDSDGDIDIVALGGGLRGRAAELAPDAMEQTFVNESGEFFSKAGPPKLGCATHGAVWEGDAMRVSCARGQPDNVWKWGGKWVGGPDDQLTKIHDVRCSMVTLLRYRVEIEERAQLCVEADFDDDGEKELVVVSRTGNKMSVAKYYELSTTMP